MPNYDISYEPSKVVFSLRSGVNSFFKSSYLLVVIMFQISVLFVPAWDSYSCLSWRGGGRHVSPVPGFRSGRPCSAHQSHPGPLRDQSRARCDRIFQSNRTRGRQTVSVQVLSFCGQPSEQLEAALWLHAQPAKIAVRRMRLQGEKIYIILKIKFYFISMI